MAHTIEGIALEDAEHRYNMAVESIVAKLKRLSIAASKERLSDSQNLSPEDAPRCAKRLLHEILWGLANLDLDSVAGYANAVAEAKRTELVRAPGKE